jgi:hypothetical protein
MGFDGELELAGSDYILMPRGTSAQRPEFPEVAMVRYNTDTSQFETWTGTGWGSLAQASGAIPSLTEITTFTPSTSNTVELTNSTVGLKTGSIGQTTAGAGTAIQIKESLTITGGIATTGLVSSPTGGFGGNLTGNVNGNITSTGTSDFSGTVDLTGATVTGYTPIAISDGTATLDFDESNNLQVEASFVPVTTNTYDLGSVENKWNNAYLNDSLYLGGSVNLGTVGISGDETNDRLTVPGINLGGSIVPDSDSAYDIGTPEKKIDHLYLSSNSLWLGDEHKIDVQDGKIKIRKRDKAVIPSKIIDLDGDETGLLASSGKASLSLVTLNDLLVYLNSLDLNTYTIEDLFPPESDADYDADDYIEIIDQSLSSRHASQLYSAVSSVTCDLYKGTSIVVDAPTSDIAIDVIGASNIEGVTIDFTLYINQGSTSRTVSGITFDGVTAAQYNIKGTASLGSNEMNVINFKAAFVGGAWKATGVVWG